jgi:hypothetical protein
VKRSEAVEIVALLEAGFVREIGDASRLVYAGELIPFEYEDGLTAARTLIASEDYFPSVALTLRATRLVRSARQLVYAPKLPESTRRPASEQRAFWRRVREELARRRGGSPPKRVGNAIPEPRLNEAEFEARGGV